MVDKQKSVSAGKASLRDQADEKHGSIRSTQQTDRNMPDKDVPRGSELERNPQK